MLTIFHICSYSDIAHLFDLIQYESAIYLTKVHSSCSTSLWQKVSKSLVIDMACQGTLSAPTTLHTPIILAQKHGMATNIRGQDEYEKCFLWLECIMLGWDLSGCNSSQGWHGDLSHSITEREAKHKEEMFLFFFLPSLWFLTQRIPHAVTSIKHA